MYYDYTEAQSTGDIGHYTKFYETRDVFEFLRARRDSEIDNVCAEVCKPIHSVESISERPYIRVIDQNGEYKNIPQDRYANELHNYRLVIVNPRQTKIYHVDMARQIATIIDGLYYVNTLRMEYEWYERISGVDFNDRAVNNIYEVMPYMLIEKLFAQNNEGIPIIVDDCAYTPQSDSIRYCDHYEEHFLEEHCNYNEEHDCYYHEDAPHRSSSSEYGETRNTRDYINDYHHGPRPIDLSNTSTARTDVAGLNKFTIGFEVEKTSVNGRRGCGQAVETQPLFSHWETDSSCGVEGVTNIYNLGDFDTFQAHVVASDYVDEQTTYDCGGHTNVAFKEDDICDYQIELSDISKFVGPIYSMYKKRLRNTYSSYNKKLRAGNHERYGAVVMKDNPRRVEFRLPSRINNKQQLLRRFKLFQHLFSHIYNYVENKEQYINTMDTVNSRLDVEFGTQTLYRNFKYDLCFRSEFYDSHVYKKIRFLLWDIKDFLEPAYKNRIDDLKIMVINSYQFQAWLDDDPTVNLTSILQYLRTHESEGPRNLLTDAQRHWSQNQSSWDIHDDLLNTEALEVAHNNTIETTEV
jgi:hypothetical protein